MLEHIVKVLWILLPAAVGNAFPPIVTKLLPKLNYPMDFNLKFNGKRVFGNHKTLRGLISGMLAAQLVFLWQKNITDSAHFSSLEIIELYSQLPIYFGFLLGLSALIGDAIKSFIKRQLGLNPGKPWLPWDQIDWIISSNVCLSFFLRTDLLFLFYSLILGFFAHIIAKTSGRLIGINDTYF